MAVARDSPVREGFLEEIWLSGNINTTEHRTRLLGFEVILHSCGVLVHLKMRTALFSHEIPN